MNDINFYAPINQTGYGVASINILSSLNKLGQKITYFPIGKPAVSSQEDYDLISKSLSIENMNPQAPCLKIWHQFDLAHRIGNGKYSAFPFFELDTFNEIEKKHMTIPDQLIVASNWAKEAIRENGISTETHVVPLGVNRDIFNPEKITKKRTDDKYVFLTIGKWEIRKGHDILPTIFKQAFPNEQDVELWILASTTTNSYSSEQEVLQWKRMYESDNRIKVLDGVNTHYDIAQLIADSNCGLYVSHAEGWNLELLETMSMNKPAIATNYSAHTEFCTPDNCFLIDVTDKEKAFDGKAFIGQGRWAKIDQKQIDQTIGHMRHAYSDNLTENPNGVETAKNFSWENSAKKLLGCIY